MEIMETERAQDEVMLQALQDAYDEQEANITCLEAQFQNLASGAFADFGCDDQCFETCYQTYIYTEEQWETYFATCAETTCCTATDSISISQPVPVETNTRCLFN